MNLEQAKLDWEEAKREVVNYFEKYGVRIDYDVTTDIATAYDNKDKIICSCYLYEDDILVKILEKKPELKSKALDYLLEKLDKTYNAYSKAKVKALNEFEQSNIF